MDFELDAANYDFAGFEGSDSAIEANPVSGGINTSATVMRATKGVGSQFFAGTLVNLDTPIDFSSTQSLKIKVYAPKANVPIRFAIENQGIGGGSQQVVDVTTTATGEWEELTFDFSGVYDPATVYNRVVIFFDFVVDQPGDGTVYYFDDIQLAD